ncbi:hypothetical protein [Thermosyntropha sp.]|uniref:hypothetical protein n=1 Tax=Thermosyntropha sp. TaxID=2740820 RepID=UPI0025D51752|nr:hypothetical protein [Thermosyntropha sp.]MBO8159067.1 hypothetical protein [Thermosyntropha sp.]
MLLKLFKTLTADIDEYVTNRNRFKIKNRPHFKKYFDDEVVLKSRTVPNLKEEEGGKPSLLLLCSD